MPSSADTFMLLVGGALVAAAAAGLLIWRARKPAPKKPAPAKEDRKSLLAWSAPALAALRYLSTSREWRYKAPWVLMLGPQAAGKTSVAQSLTGCRRQGLLLQERKLAIEGTDWHFCDRGVVIDPSGLYSGAEPDSAEARRWRAILSELDEQRPERPLDAVVLAVPAPTLLRGSALQRMQLASMCYRQLWTLQKRFDFVLPVYVVVTQCDTIDGFSAYWRAQRKARGREIIGWSNPALLGGEPALWVDGVFSGLGEGLRALQVDAAAHSGEIADADRFFLFPERLGELKAPLGGFLETISRPSAYHESFFFRGVYFSGSPAAEGMLDERPRGDVAFVDDLFERRIFEELHLARPTRQGIWSRNRLVRRLQIAGVALGAGLSLALAAAALRLQEDVAALIASLHSLRAERLDTVCEDREGVYALVAAIARVPAHMSYAAIPLSRLDSRITDDAGHEIARRSFARVILPGLRCRLEQRAAALVKPELELMPYLAQVGAFERNLERFARFVEPGRDHGDEDPKSAFAGLLEYAYGAPAPREIADERGALGIALAHARYPRRPEEPSTIREEVAGRVARGAREQRQELLVQVRWGAQGLRTLERGEGSLAETARRLNTWVEWVRSEWLRSSESANPCARLETALRQALAPLPRSKYGTFDGALGAFGAEHCYRPARRILVDMQVAPFGPIFRAEGDALAFAIGDDLAGLPALAAQPFMQRSGAASFACQAGGAGWRAQSVADAQRFVRDYQEYARAQGVEAAAAVLGRRPFFDRVARGALRSVLDETLQGAQVAEEADAAAPRDQDLAQASAEFSRVSGPLLQLMDAMLQLGFAGSHAKVVQCARDFSNGMLLRTAALAETSRLYEPPPGEKRFFDLGSTASTKDYLAQQLARADVLARHAAPFAAFLKNTDPVNDGEGDARERGPYWDNTAAELSRYVQFKDQQAGQVALLESFFVKQLAVLTDDNCGKVLASYEDAGDGDDLFATRRRALEAQARELCADRSRASAYALYRDIARRFNRELAHRYPFSDATEREAPLGAVRAFFVDYEGKRESLGKALAQLDDEHGAEVQRFVGELDAAAAFFRGTLAAAGASQPLKVDVGFRALPKQSPGSEQLIEWQLRAGERQARYPAGPAGLDYAFGAPVALELSWASQSSLRPLAEPAQPELRVRDATAAFSASGAWGLLRLIDAHRPRYVPALDPLDPDRVLLEFVVPVGAAAPGSAPGPASGAARLYLALNFSGLDPKTQAQTRLSLPASFPRSAPVAW